MSTCELELLRLLRDVDLAVLEKHQTWKSRLDAATSAIRQKDAELEQTREELRLCREEIDQLRDHIAGLETFQGDLVSKYDRRLGELRHVVGKLKQRCCEAKPDAPVRDEGALAPEIEFWRSKSLELERQVGELEHRLEEVSRNRAPHEDQPNVKREQQLSKTVAEKDRVIDRLTEKVTELTKRLRHLEEEAVKSKHPLNCGGGSGDFVDDFLRVFQRNRSRDDAADLRRKIKEHMEDVTVKFEQDRRAL